MSDPPMTDTGPQPGQTIAASKEYALGVAALQTALDRITELERQLSEARAELAREKERCERLGVDLDNAWEQFRRMRSLLAETKYGDRLQNQVYVNAMKEKNDNQI